MAELHLDLSELELAHGEEGKVVAWHNVDVAESNAVYVFVGGAQ